ncbi:MAG: alpha/beta hydrolase [Pseudomonadota bacterium]
MKPLAFALLTLAATPGVADTVWEIEGNRAYLDGSIDWSTLDELDDILRSDPQVDTLVLGYVEGSLDDEANLELAREIRALGWATLVPAEGLVASGGTDLFLAGTTRSLEPGACVGVHAWATDDFTANDLARSDPEHGPYLYYFADIGIPEAFYWFTLEAAPAHDMHWMTAAEVDRFGLTTEAAPPLGNERDCRWR